MKWTGSSDPSRPSAIERAFQLAKSGRCRSMRDIRMALRAEGYPDYQLEGKVLIEQLRALMQSPQTGGES